MILTFARLCAAKGCKCQNRTARHSSRAIGAHFYGWKAQDLLEFEVLRPVRHMAIANPCVISPIRRTDVILWFSEYGDTSKAPDEHTDPNEIVVVAKGSKIKPLHAIIVGRDDMAQCSSITFDKPAWQIRVWCQ